MEKTLIIDCGRHSTKYSLVMPSKKKNPDVQVSYADVENLSELPISVTDWLDCTSTILSEKITDEDELTLVFLVQTLFPRWEKEALLASAFEYYGAKKVCIEYSPPAALFSCGETQGTVFDVGYTGVRITPVFKGSPLFDYSSSFNDIGSFFAENELTSFLSSVLSPYGKKWRSLLTQIMPGVAESSNATSCSLSQEVVLPDGSSLDVSIPSEVIQRAEERLLYSKKTNFLDEVWHTNMRTSTTILSSRFMRIGGVSEWKYFSACLLSLLDRTYLSKTPVELQIKNSLCAPVLGGCIFSQLSSFKSLCISVADYTDDGPHGCIRLCGSNISKI